MLGLLGLELSEVVVVEIRVLPPLLFVSLFCEDGGCGGRVGQAAEEEDTLQHIVQGESRGTRRSQGNVQSKAVFTLQNYTIVE